MPTVLNNIASISAVLNYVLVALHYSENVYHTSLKYYRA